MHDIIRLFLWVRTDNSKDILGPRLKPLPSPEVMLAALGRPQAWGAGQGGRLKWARWS